MIALLDDRTTAPAQRSIVSLACAVELLLGLGRPAWAEKLGTWSDSSKMPAIVLSESGVRFGAVPMGGAL